MRRAESALTAWSAVTGLERVGWSLLGVVMDAGGGQVVVG